MPGGPDPRYVLARAVLLDALAALGDQRNAVIVVGAQAVYLHTGAIDLALPEFTIDADITFDPALLKEAPEIEAAMLGARFVRGTRVGVWIASRDVAGVPPNVEVDLMVPDAVGGPGRRAARLRGHAKEVARKTRGLEAALVDKMVVSIRALEPTDSRAFDVAIAGPATLLIAKAHKIAERVAEREHRRLEDQDALDVLRLLQATETAALAATVNALLHADVAREVTRVHRRRCAGRLHAAGAVDLAVPEFTLDADITIDPALLHDVPEIEAAMLVASFPAGTVNRRAPVMAQNAVSFGSFLPATPC